MKTRDMTVYIEIPVKVYYTPHPEERMTATYPGCPAHITVESVCAPDEENIYKEIDKYADYIKEQCEEDAEEGPDEDR